MAAPKVRGFTPLALDLGRRARVLLAGAYIAGQGALILTASRRADHIFGYRMFPEASTIEIHLWRDTGVNVTRTPRGEWSARDASGQLRHFSWHDRVRDPVLSSLDSRVFASYGVEAQLARLQRALDDVMAHLGEDDETRQLRAEVVVRKNGGEPVVVTLLSAARGESTPHSPSAPGM